AAALALFAVAGIFLAERIRERSQLIGWKANPRIIILPFRNATGDRGMKWIELGLMDHVIRSLHRVPSLDVVAPEAVTKFGPKTADDRKRLMAAVGADAIVDSSVSFRDDRYVITYTISDARHTERPQEAGSTILTEAANKMADQLAKRADPRHFVRRVGRGTSDAFAALAFDIGREVEITRGGKFAEKYFAVAADRDPEFLDAKQALAELYARQGRAAEADAAMEEVIREARRRGDKSVLVSALINHGFARQLRGDVAVADSATQEALKLAQQLGRVEIEVYALNARGVFLRSMNRLDEADAAELKALRLARERNVPYIKIAALNNLGTNAMRRNDNKAARKWFEESLQLGKQLGYRETSGIVMG